MNAGYFRFILSALVLLGISLWSSSTIYADDESAEGTTIAVTTNQDEYDTNGAGAGCSLREAITAANTDTAFGGCPAGNGKDKITLQTTFYMLERAGDDDTNERGDLDVTAPVTIKGTGIYSSFVNGNALDRVMTTSADGVKLVDLTLQNGGNVHNGGGVLTTQKLTLENVNVFGNSTTGSGGGIAVIAPFGELIMNHSLAEDNTSVLGGGGIFVGGKATLRDSIVQGNQTTGNPAHGGGIFNSGTLLMFNSTIYQNTANYDGGGLYNNNAALVVNSTLSDNDAMRNGGGIANDDDAAMDLYSVTIADNHADANNNGNGSGGGISNPNCQTSCNTVALYNTLISNNFRKNVGPIGDDVTGVFISGGYNLVEQPSASFSGDTTHLIVGQDAALGALQTNGGFAPTHALQAASPARDAGNPAGCRDQNNALLATDERGAARSTDSDGVNGPRCDIGAYEMPIAATCVQKPGNPAALSPADASVTNEVKLQLLWTGAHCAVTFKVTLRQDSKKGTVVATQSNLTLSQYGTPKLKYKTYFWRVRACNPYGCTNSKWFKFTRVKS